MAQPFSPAKAARNYAHACDQFTWTIRNAQRIRASLGRDASAYHSALRLVRLAARWKMDTWAVYVGR